LDSRVRQLVRVNLVNFGALSPGTDDPALSWRVSPDYHAAAVSKILLLRSRDSSLRQSVERAVRNRRAILEVRPKIGSLPARRARVPS
jgi:hypothetical protein